MDGHNPITASLRREACSETARFVVVTTCTNRKRLPVADGLQARALSKGEPVEVARIWFQRLATAPGPRVSVRDLYCGRSFREAQAAALALEAPLFVVSAGLGLVAAEVQAPAYSMTLVRESPDSVLQKLERCGPQEWWGALAALSPFHQSEPTGSGLILAALSGPYLQLVAADWLGWPAAKRARLRIFCKDPGPEAPEALRAQFMPYDDRLDGVGAGFAGTQGDFAQRAMRHFAEHVAMGPGDAQTHACKVKNLLAPVEARERPIRDRLSDEQLIALIHDEWEAVGGRSSAMLHRLRRQLNVACEQSRFKGLFKRAAAMRPGALL